MTGQSPAFLRDPSTKGPPYGALTRDTIDQDGNRVHLVQLHAVNADGSREYVCQTDLKEGQRFEMVTMGSPHWCDPEPA